MKILKMLLCCIMLCACSQSEKKDESKEDYHYIVFATPLDKHEIWLKAKDGMEDACDELGYYCDWLGPSVIDTEEMNHVISSAIAQGASGIITQGVVDPKLIERGEKKNIPTVLVDSDMPNSARHAYFGKNFHQQAQIFLDEIQKRLGNDTYLKIGIQVAESKFEIAQEQIQQIKEVFKKHKGGFEIVSVSESKSDKVRAKKEWNQSFDKHKYNVVINFAGESVAACSEIAMQRGIRDDLLIYGVDDMSETIQLIKDGAIDGSVVTSFYNYGYKSVLLIDEYLKEGDTLSNKVQDIPIMMVTKENVDHYENEFKDNES